MVSSSRHGLSGGYMAPLLIRWLPLLLVPPPLCQFPASASESCLVSDTITGPSSDRPGSQFKTTIRSWRWPSVPVWRMTSIDPSLSPLEIPTLNRRRAKAFTCFLETNKNPLHHVSSRLSPLFPPPTPRLYHNPLHSSIMAGIPGFVPSNITLNPYSQAYVDGANVQIAPWVMGTFADLFLQG